MSGHAPFHHVASLNLFRKSYGHEITVSIADKATIAETPAGLKPIDHVENLIIAAAMIMRDQKLANGTFRDVPSTQDTPDMRATNKGDQ